MVGRGDVTGRGAVTDLGNGSYSAAFSVPMPGEYMVHVTHLDLGSETPSHVRGSPFCMVCEDAWSKPRVLGAVPQKRKAATLLPVGQDVVLFGGDAGKPYVLNTTGTDWRWSAMSLPEGAPEPLPRTAHGACLTGSNEIVIFAGVSLADQTELSDVWKLSKQSGEWAWACAPASLPFKRELKRLKAEELSKLPEPRGVPASGMHVQLTPAEGEAFWLEGHKWNAGGTHTVELTGVDTETVKAVKFYLNGGPDDGADPVHVATSAPYVMGLNEDGAAKHWAFDEGVLTIVAVAEPVTAAADGGETVKVSESATVLPEGGIEVRTFRHLALASFVRWHPQAFASCRRARATLTGW